MCISKNKSQDISLGFYVTTFYCKRRGISGTVISPAIILAE